MEKGSGRPDGGKPSNSGAEQPRYSILNSELSALLRRLNLKPPKDALFRTRFGLIMVQLETFDRRKDDFNTEAPKQVLREAKAFAAALGKVEAVMSFGASTRREIRRALGPVLGASLSLQAFEQSHVPVSTETSIHTRIGRAANMREGPYRALEEEITAARTVAAGRAGERALTVFVREMRVALERHFQFSKHARSGPKGDQRRRIVIVGLALNFQELFGRRPTETENGAFVKLCAEVLSLFNLSTDGLAEAVGRMLKDMRCMRHPAFVSSKSRKREYVLALPPIASVHEPASPQHQRRQLSAQRSRAIEKRSH
jgi:hypothetical protein